MTPRQSKQGLRALVKARKQPTAHILCKIPAELVQMLCSYYQENIHSENILRDSINYRKERNVALDHEINLVQNYGQVALQSLHSEALPTDRLAFDTALSPKIIKELQSYLGDFSRARVSGLERGASIPEHIDDPDQIRVIALLAGEQELSIRTKSESVIVPMKIGEAWYINTAWPHKVTNTGQTKRLCLLVDLHKLPIFHK